MPGSPTPSERERKDAEARAREKEEQAKLPYKWTQTIKDLDVTVPVAGNLRGKDIEVVMTKTKLKVAVKGQEAVIDVRIYPSILLLSSRRFQLVWKGKTLPSPWSCDLAEASRKKPS